MTQDETASTPEAESADRLHASCVALGDVGILFIGASGSGKSASCLAMIAHGAVLVSDDQLRLSCEGDAIFAHSIEGYEGMIEARGVGILETPFTKRVEVGVVVDMDSTELHRLPPYRTENLLGIEIPKIFGRENPFLVPSLLTLARGARLK